MVIQLIFLNGFLKGQGLRRDAAESPRQPRCDVGGLGGLHQEADRGAGNREVGAADRDAKQELTTGCGCLFGVVKIAVNGFLIFSYIFESSAKRAASMKVSPHTLLLFQNFFNVFELFFSIRHCNRSCALEGKLNHCHSFAYSREPQAIGHILQVFLCYCSICLDKFRIP